MATLERWYYAFREGGLDALRPKARVDRGRGRDLNDEQKKILRFAEQPDFLKRAQPYPAPDEALDKKMQDMWTEMLQAQ
mgnify:CR=1 FL=1